MGDGMRTTNANAHEVMELAENMNDDDVKALSKEATQQWRDGRIGYAYMAQVDAVCRELIQLRTFVTNVDMLMMGLDDG